MTKPTQVQPPRAAKSDIQRLSENGGGAVQWGLETDYALSDVKEPGFFQSVGKHGFQKNDRIYLVCQQHQSIVTHATLVVTGVRFGPGIEVAQLGEAFEVEIGVMTPFERLGLGPKAKKNEIDEAYRERAKRLHPDKGGGKTEMQALNKARNEATLIADHKEQAA